MRAKLGLVAFVGALALSLLIATASSCRFLSLPSLSEATASVAGSNQSNQRGQTERIEDDALLNESDELLLYRGVYCAGDWTRWYTTAGASSPTPDANNGNSMKILSTLFLSLALFFGSLSTGTACVALLGPTNRRSHRSAAPLVWLVASVSAAVCAICCVPVFLLFSTRACVSPDEYSTNEDTEATNTDNTITTSCRLASGSYLLLGSLFLWILLTILTQCMDPPHLTEQTLKARHMVNDVGASDAPVPVQPAESNRPSRFWFPFWYPSSISYTNATDSPDLKVDRTMEEDEEDGLVGHYSQCDPYESIEVTAAVHALCPTILEQDEDDDDTTRDDGLDRSDRTRVRSNESNGMFASTYIPNEPRSLLDDESDMDSGVVLSLQPLYSSSLIESERVTRVDPPLYDSSTVDTSTVLSYMTSATLSQMDGLTELDASLDAELTATSVREAAPPMDPASIYFGRAALADSDSDDDVYLAEEKKTDPFDGRVLVDSDEDLGSLEPTVSEVTGEESILDHESQIASRTAAALSTPLLGPMTVPKEAPLGQSARALVQKIMQPKDVKSAAVRAKSAKPANRRRNRIVKGYKLMDDSDISSSYPWSPPLEILTLNLARDTELEMESNLSPNATDQDLLDEWNTIHRRSSPTFAQSYSEEPEPMLDEEMDYHDHEDLQSYDRGAPDDEPVTEELDPVPSTEGAARSRRRGRRAHRSRGGRSVASSTSLLSATIEEETAADLATTSEESEGDDDRDRRDAHKAIPYARSRSAPALARFGRPKTNIGKVCEDLHMTGIHSFHTAQIFRKTDDSTKSSRGGKQSGGGSTASGQSTPRAGHYRPWNRRLVPPSSFSVPEMPTTRAAVSPRKIPMFREERASRAGIHAQSYMSDPSSSEDKSAVSSPSLRSRQARQARLRRLQGQQQQQQQQQQETPTRLPMALRQRRSSLTPPRSKVNVLHHRPAGKPGSEVDTNSDSKDNTSFDSGNYMIDLLDVQLAQLNRPEGANIGPDEVSV